RRPLGEIVLDEVVREFGIDATGLRGYHRDDAPGRPLHEVPDERIADAKAHYKKPVDPEVIELAKLVSGVCIPGLIEIERAAGLAAVRVAQVHADAAVL